MAPKKTKPATDPKYTLDVSKEEVARLKKVKPEQRSPGEHLIYLAAQQLNHSAFLGITEEIARVQGEAFTKEFEEKALKLESGKQYQLTPQQQLAFIQCSTTPPEKLATLFKDKFTGVDKDGNNTPLLVTADEIQQVRDIAAGRTKDRGQLVENALDNLTREKGKLERAPARGLMPSASLTNDGMEEAAKKFRHNLDKMRDTQKMELNPAQQKMILLHGGMSPKELARASGHFSNHDFPKTEVDARKQLSELRGAEGVRAMVYASGMRVTEEFSSKLYAKLSDPNLEVPKEAKPAFDALKTMATATSPEDMKKGWEAFQKCPQEVKMAWKAVANTTAEGMLKETRQEQAARDQACVDYFKTEGGVDLSHERAREVYRRLAKEGDETAKSMVANINKMAQGTALTEEEKGKPARDVVQKSGKEFDNKISKAKGAVQEFKNHKITDPAVAEGVYARICRDAANGVPNAQIWKDAFDNNDFSKFSSQAMQQMGVKMQTLQTEVVKDQSIPRLQQVAAKQGVEMDDATARVIDAKVTRDYNSGVLDKDNIQAKFKDTAAIESEAKRAKATIEAVQNMAAKQGRIISPEVAARVYEGIAQQADRQGKAGEGAQKLLDQLHDAAAGKSPKYKITTPTLDAHITHAQNAEFAAPSRSVAEVQAVVAAAPAVVRQPTPVQLKTAELPQEQKPGVVGSPPPPTATVVQPLSPPGNGLPPPAAVISPPLEQLLSAEQAAATNGGKPAAEDLSRAAVVSEDTPPIAQTTTSVLEDDRMPATAEMLEGLAQERLKLVDALKEAVNFELGQRESSLYTADEQAKMREIRKAIAPLQGVDGAEMSHADLMQHAKNFVEIRDQAFVKQFNNNELEVANEQERGEQQEERNALRVEALTTGMVCKAALVMQLDNPDLGIESKREILQAIIPAELQDPEEMQDIDAAGMVALKSDFLEATRIAPGQVTTGYLNEDEVGEMLVINATLVSCVEDLNAESDVDLVDLKEIKELVAACTTDIKTIGAQSQARGAAQNAEFVKGLLYAPLTPTVDQADLAGAGVGTNKENEGLPGKPVTGIPKPQVETGAPANNVMARVQAMQGALAPSNSSLPDARTDEQKAAAKVGQVH